MKKYNRQQQLKKALTLYGITDRTWLSKPFPPGDPVGTQYLIRDVEACLAGGVTMLQLREKNRPHSVLLETGRAVQAVCRRFSVPFIVDDDVEAARELDADGVHVGQHDWAAVEVRNSIGPDKLLGVSVQTPEQAVRAQAAGADYLGVGALFTTATKPDADIVTIEQLAAVCKAVTIPVVAIGGINGRTIRSLAGTGIAGAAVVSALFGAPDKTAAAAALRAVCNDFSAHCTVWERTRTEQSRRTSFLSRIRAAVFDLDGTLIDSMPVWKNAGRLFLESQGLRPDPDLWEKTARMSMEQSAHYFINTYGVPGSPAAVMNGINQCVFEQYAQRIPLKHGVLQFLDELSARGIPIALATATDRVCAEACLKRLGIERYFRQIITCTETGAGKDHPLVYETAQTLLEFPKEQTGVFEDALHAAETAQRAGFPVCAVYDECTLDASEWFRLRQLADCSCFSLTDLLA